MDNTIRITMLGATGSGKTCYMLGMYAVMREGVRGFTFTTRDEDPDSDLDLELSERWERLVGETGDDRWPQPNDIGTITYTFDFTHGLSTLIGFDWIDYRGRALMEHPAEAEVQELKQHLNRSAAVLLCVSGEHFAPGSAGRVSTAAVTPRMLRFLKHMREQGGEPPAVGIVITKFDLCRQVEEAALLDAVRRLFTPLFEPDPAWLVMVCPVSLGNDLARDPGGGTIDPKNVHLPVSFAVYSAFRHGQRQLAGRIADKEKEIGGLRGGWLRNWWNSGEIGNGNRRREEMERQKAQIDRNLRLLARDLVTGARFYYGGERVDLE